MARKDELLALARRKGFNSYTEYRNYLAQLQGYRNYSEQRRARRTGIGLKGKDVETYAAKAQAAGTLSTITDRVSAASGRAIGRRNITKPPTLPELGPPGLYELDWEVQGLVRQFANQERFIGVRHQHIGEHIGRRKEAMRQKITGSLRGTDNLVSRAYRMGLEGAGVDPSISKEEMKWITAKAGETAGRLDRALDQYHRNARNWDKVAARAGGPGRAKQVAKINIWAYEGQGGKRHYGLASYEGMLLNGVGREAFVRGLMAGFRKQNVKFVRVSDGPDCGWTSHGDIQKADGMVVTVDEAMNYPQAHENCRRQFHPIHDSDEAEKEAKRQKRERAGRRQLSDKAKKTVAKAAVAAAIVGVATTEINTASFSGTIGNFAINGMGTAARRGIALMIRMQERALAALQRQIVARGFETRLRSAAQDLANETGMSINEALRQVADQVHAEADLFDQAGEAGANVISLVTRRVLGVPEIATRKIVGDEFNDWEKYYRLNFKNAATDATATQVAELFQSQNVFVQGLMNRVKIRGKYARFTMPKINTIDGNTGRRVTNRYARLSLPPNKLMHAHVSATPRLDGTVRLIENIRLNPNGLARLGFVRREDGLITPNLSLVPKGPIRVYSRLNRASPFVTRTVEVYEDITNDIANIIRREADATSEAAKLLRAVERAKRTPAGYMPDFQEAVNGVGDRIIATGETVTRVRKVKRQVPNPVAGRVNSITTEIRLLTPWVPFNDSSWFKFRLDLRSLDIYKPQDILQIDPVQWRRWAMQLDEEGRRRPIFKFLSAGTNLRLRGFNLFDFSRSIRFDSQSFQQAYAGLSNIDNNLRELIDFYKTEIGGKTLGWEKASDSFDLYARLMYLYLDADPAEQAAQAAQLIDRLEELRATAKAQGGAAFQEATDRLSMWQGAQWYWHLVMQNIRDRAEQLTDYLIEARRGSAAKSAPSRIGAAERGYRELIRSEIYGSPDDLDDIMFERPNLLAALIETDPKLLAKRVGVDLQDVDAVKQRLLDRIQHMLTQHLDVLPERWRLTILNRLERGRLFDDYYSPGDSDAIEAMVSNTTGKLRWMEGAPSYDDLAPGRIIVPDEGRIILRSTRREAIESATFFDEVFEYTIHGESVQRRFGNDLLVHGEYRVLAVETLNRGDEGFPEYLPGTVERFTTVTLRQTRSYRGAAERPSYVDIAAATVDAQQLPPTEHLERLEIFRRSYPELTFAADFFRRNKKIVRDVIERRGRRSAQATHAAEVLLDALDDSRPTPNNLYRVISESEADALRRSLTRGGEIMDEVLGEWSAVIDRDVPVKGRRVILVLRNARALNISPLLPGEHGSSTFLSGGRYRRVQELEESRPDGSGNIWIYLDFVRGHIRRS